MLNCRIEGMNNSKPDLIIIDLNLKLKKNLHLTKLNKKRKTYIVTTVTEKKKILPFKKKNYKIILIKSLCDKNDFILLFKKIFRIGYGRILLETGLTFLSELIKKKLLNELYIFKSNKNLTLNGLNNISASYIKNYKLHKIINVNLNEDKLYKIKIK